MMMDRNTSYALQQLEGRKAGIAGVGALNQGLNDNAMQMAMEDEAARRANTNAYTQGLQNAAQYSDQEFQLNKMQPYEMALQRAMALQGSGLQNMYGAKLAFGNLAKEGFQTALQLGMGAATGGASGITSGLGSTGATQAPQLSMTPEQVAALQSAGKYFPSATIR